MRSGLHGGGVSLCRGLDAHVGLSGAADDIAGDAKLAARVSQILRRAGVHAGSDDERVKVAGLLDGLLGLVRERVGDLVVADGGDLRAAALLDGLAGVLDVEEHRAQHAHLIADTLGVHDAHIGHAVLDEELRGLAADTAAAEDDGLAVRHGLAGQHVLSNEHVRRGIQTGDVRLDEVCAGGDDHVVGLDFLDELGRHGDTGLDLDAHALALLGVPHDGVGEGLLLRGLTGEDEVAARGVGGFIDGRVVAARLEVLGCHQAADAGADDHDVLGSLRLRETLVLEAERRVAGAGDVGGLRVDDLVVAALGAADAAADLRLAAFHGLVAPFGIGELRTANGDHVDLALTDELIGQSGVDDAADADDRNVHALFDGGDVIHVEARLQVVGRHFVHGGKAAGVAAGQVDRIDTGLGGPVDELHGLVLRGHGREHLVDGVQTHEQRHILGHVLAHLADDFEVEAAAVLEALVAVLVGALVERGVHEFVRQVSVRAVELECVKAGFDGELGGVAELLDDLVDALDGQRVRRLKLVGLVEELFGHEAAVPDLHGRLAAGSVDRVGDLAQLISVVLIIKAEVQVGMALGADGDKLDNVQAAAAGRTRSVVGGQVLADVMLVLDHFGVHTRQNHTVFQLKPSELDGRKQCIVTHEIHLS